MKKNKLQVTLRGDHDIVMSREFDAPRELVFEAWTRTEHVRRWYAGCMGMEVIVCDIDLRVGGRYRYVLRMENGEEHGFAGEYREIGPPEKLVHTHIYDPFPQSVAVVTITFEDLGGRTLMTEVTAHPTKESRDGHVMSGMEEGATGALDALEELLGTLHEA